MVPWGYYPKSIISLALLLTFPDPTPLSKRVRSGAHTPADISGTQETLTEAPPSSHNKVPPVDKPIWRPAAKRSLEDRILRLAVWAVKGRL